MFCRHSAAHDIEQMRTTFMSQKKKYKQHLQYLQKKFEKSCESGKYFIISFAALNMFVRILWRLFSCTDVKLALLFLTVHIFYYFVDILSGYLRKNCPYETKILMRVHYCKNNIDMIIWHYFFTHVVKNCRHMACEEKKLLDVLFFKTRWHSSPKINRSWWGIGGIECFLNEPYVQLII